MRLETLVLLSLWPLAASAGRPLVTDDAALTSAGTCQIESWTQHSERLSEWYVLPACNPGGNFEFTTGPARFRAQGGEWTNRLLLQGKTVFAWPDLGWLAAGLAGGGWLGGDEPTGRGGFAQLYAYVPLTAQLLDERLRLHANLGWTRDRLLSLDRGSWGLAAQWAMSDQDAVFVESYGADVGAAFTQFGYSRMLAVDRWQLDLSAGRQFGAEGTEFIALGLNFYFASID